LNVNIFCRRPLIQLCLIICSVSEEDEITVQVKFCRKEYDFVAIAENCPAQFSETFTAYAVDSTKSNPYLTIAKLDRYIFSAGFRTTPIMRQKFTFAGLRRSGEIYIRGIYTLFIGTIL